MNMAYFALQMSSDSGDYVHYDMAFDDRDEGTTASASLAGLATNSFFLIWLLQKSH